MYFGLLYVHDIIVVFLHRYTSTNVVNKLLVPSKNVAFDGVSEGMLNLTGLNTWKFNILILLID